MSATTKEEEVTCKTNAAPGFCAKQMSVINQVLCVPTSAHTYCSCLQYLQIFTIIEMKEEMKARNSVLMCASCQNPATVGCHRVPVRQAVTRFDNFPVPVL